MTNLAFIVVALRLVGIWIVLVWGFQFLNAYAIYSAELGGKFYSVIFSTTGVGTVFGVVMVIWPLAIARLLTPVSVRSDVSMVLSPEDFQLDLIVSRSELLSSDNLKRWNIHRRADL